MLSSLSPSLGILVDFRQVFLILAVAKTSCRFHLSGGVSVLSDEINEKRSIRQPDGGARHLKDL